MCCVSSVSYREPPTTEVGDRRDDRLPWQPAPGRVQGVIRWPWELYHDALLPQIPDRGGADRQRGSDAVDVRALWGEGTDTERPVHDREVPGQQELPQSVLPRHSHWSAQTYWAGQPENLVTTYPVPHVVVLSLLSPVVAMAIARWMLLERRIFSNQIIYSDFSLIRMLSFLQILCGLLYRPDYWINLCRNFDICSHLALIIEDWINEKLLYCHVSQWCLQSPFSCWVLLMDNTTVQNNLSSGDSCIAQTG